MKKLSVILFMTLLLAVSTSAIQARHFASQQARFTSPDPITITQERMVDPQQLNLYSYARNNPLIYIDPSGMDITVTGTEKDEYKKRLQGSITSFTINMDANGKIGIDGTVDAKKLKGGDKKLYQAITDQNHHVSIATTSGDGSVDFGRFNGGGSQTLDFADIKCLDSPSNQGGLSGSTVVAHETLEAYTGAVRGYTSPTDLSSAHNAVKDTFPGFRYNPLVGGQRLVGRNNMVYEQTLFFTIDGGSSRGTNVGITWKLQTPVPNPPNNLPLTNMGNAGIIKVNVIP